MCCYSESITKEGKDYSQTDPIFGPVAITNNFWDMFTGVRTGRSGVNDDVGLGKFKLYLLIKNFILILAI